MGSVGLLFAAGLFFRPVCVAMPGVMVMATIDQLGREDAAAGDALKNALVLAGDVPHRSRAIHGEPAIQSPSMSLPRGLPIPLELT